MVSPTFYEENGDDVVYTTPVGTGPFVCVSSNLDSEIVYEKNENYWQEGKPYLDGIEITLCNDAHHCCHDYEKRGRRYYPVPLCDPSPRAGRAGLPAAWER